MRMANACLAVISKENPCFKQGNTRVPVVVTCLGVSASKFVDQLENNSRIDRFFVTKNSAETNKEKEPYAEQEALHENDELNENSTDQEDEENEFVETERILDIEEESITAPEPNTTDSASECTEAESVSVNREMSSMPISNQENCGIVKKTGFFASRCLDKNTPIQSAKESVPEPAALKIVGLQESFSVEELFPDLNQVDMETLALLPLHLQRQVLQAIEARKGSYGNDKFVVCDKCKQQFLREEIEEHKDFHLASELQKEFSAQPSTSSLANNSKVQTAEKKSSKRPLKNQKKAAKDTKRSRTIDSFFGSQS